MADDIKLSFSDLKLLMDTYQNMIQMNTILLEQQKQLIELQTTISKNQGSINIKQDKAYEKIDSISKSISEYSKDLESITTVLKQSHETLGETFSSKLLKTQDKLDKFQLDVVSQHSGLNNKIYVALIGMGSIILALLGLLGSVLSKYTTIDELHSMLHKIITYFSIGS